MKKAGAPFPLEDQAVLIAGEIFNLTNQYTHDSNTPKFFLPDEVANSCYILAGGFAGMVYNPELDAEDVQDTHVLSFIYALITYGFNIYLKERSFITHGKPYSLPTDKKIIKKAQRETLALTSNAKLLSTPLSAKIIKIIAENIESKLSMKEFRLKGHTVKKTKFLDYSKLSLYWGYNFATKLLEQEVKQ